MDLVVARPEGLYCPPGDFFIDPWRPVPFAVITHAHGDHARPGAGRYLASAAGEHVLRTRLGEITLQTLPYGETIVHRGVGISLHPAGHVLGSAQVRISHGGQTWVVSGDYRVEADRTCTAFEPVRCDVFVTESTFGLPIYRWPPQAVLFDAINAWWRTNADAGRTSLMFCYAFGKAQRLLAGLAPEIGPIIVHGAVAKLDAAYRASGVALPPVLRVGEVGDRAALRRAIVLAPPSARQTPWARRFVDPVDAFASGWMLVRGARRRRGVDRGFALSDHADWPGLAAAIDATGAERIVVTHGQVEPMVRWLRERGLDAGAFATEYGETAEDDDGAGPEDARGAND